MNLKTLCYAVLSIGLLWGMTSCGGGGSDTPANTPENPDTPEKPEIPSVPESDAFVKGADISWV
ncbi:MAG: hypothetical protein ACI378_01030, partial [Bacteroides sp.]